MDSEDEANLSAEGHALLYRCERQRASDRRRIRDKYQELIQVAKQEKDNEDINADTVIQNMDQADELFKEVCRTSEAMLDAKLLNIHGEITKKKAHSIQAGTSFNAVSFVRKLASVSMGKPVDSDVIDIDEEGWLNLGNRVFRMFNRTPKLNFIHGTFLEPVETARQPRRAKEKETKTKTTEPKVIDAGSQMANSDKTYQEIQRIKRILTQLYIHEGKPLGYFEFAIDPHSFSRTIENMFHIAFLVKEREVILSLDSDELPVIAPVLSHGGRGGGGTGSCETGQSVLTMSVNKWKQLVEVFEIREPKIPPPPQFSRPR